MSEEILTLVPDADIARRRADAAFEAIAAHLRTVLPVTCEIHHVGATSVPGCLGKGDLDINVRAPRADFAGAEAALVALYPRNHGNASLVDMASFEDGTCNPPLGVQLTIAGGKWDVFTAFRDALCADGALVGEYNAIKRRFDGRDMEAYRAAKADFADYVLARTGR